MDLYSFDAAYLERLKAGDAATERHFTKYFGELILIKLRARHLPPSTIEDIRQETFLRVLQTLRRDGIREPERVGAFVITVCRNIMMEFARSGARNKVMDGEMPELVDERADSERELVTHERQERVRAILDKLSSKNRRLLTAVFLEERPSEEICKQFGVDANYLRVMLFRARAQFRQAAGKGPDSGKV